MVRAYCPSPGCTTTIFTASSAPRHVAHSTLHSSQVERDWRCIYTCTSFHLLFSWHSESADIPELKSNDRLMFDWTTSNRTSIPSMHNTFFRRNITLRGLTPYIWYNAIVSKNILSLRYPFLKIRVCAV